MLEMPNEANAANTSYADNPTSPVKTNHNPKIVITPTQRAAIDRRKAFKLKIGGLAVTRRVIPITQVEPVSVTIHPKYLVCDPAGPDADGKVYRNENYYAFGPVVCAPRSVEEKQSDVYATRVKVEEVVRATYSHFNISKVELLSDRRLTYVVRARQVGMYVAKLCTGRSLPFIGEKFGKKDHTTVINSIRKVHARILAGDIDTISAVDALMAKFSFVQQPTTGVTSC